MITTIQVSAGVFNDTICSGSSITIGNVYPTATLYQWNTTPPQYTATITVNPVVSTTYIVNVFSGTTWLVADTFNVITNPLPTGTITPPQSICAGSSATLTATGGVTYLWSPGGATTASITVSPSVTTTYSVIITGTNGCSITLSSVVTVNPLPTFTSIGSNSPLCEGSTLNLYATANTGSTYDWTGPNSFTSNLQNPSISNVTILNAGNYTVTATLNGCTASTSTGVVINTPPTLTVSGSSSVCSGSTIYLFANGSSGSTYSWTGPNGFSSSLQNPIISNASTVNSGWYVATATLNTCSSQDSILVTVNTAPVVSITGNLNICSGSSTTLTATGGGTYLWSTSVTTSSITVSPSVTTTYWVTVTGTNGCSTTAYATVFVNSGPTISFSPANPQVCEGENIVVTAMGANTYSWSNGTNGSSISVNPTTTTTYTVTGTSSQGCTTTASVTILVDPKPIVSLNLPQSQICLDANPITLNGGSPVGGSYYGSGIFGGMFYPSTVGVGTYTISYEYTNSYGCTSTATTLLTVNPLPTVIFNSIYPNPVNINAAAFQLNTGIPLGGIYSGPGVVNGWFYPSVAGVGIHTITYTYIDFMSCANTVMQTITVAGNVGIEEQSSKSIRIYPNPVNNFLNVELEEIPNLVQIVDLTGHVLLSQKVDSENFKIDVSYLSRGIYFIHFNFEDGYSTSTKFIK
ncbi:T9SS type A sorting domain-containing protein [Candidatus Gracilibacteria bacterium]|nr:T9SS type A sorting domain-containing protein [Candidatus Gracilibacteria bacterium]